jgi:hypothetical protein
LYSLIFEVRHDSEGEYFRLLTLWKATREEQELYEGIRKKGKRVSAESIARLADQEKSVSRFFTNSGRMVPPIQHLTDLMLNVFVEARLETRLLFRFFLAALRPCRSRDRPLRGRAGRHRQGAQHQPPGRHQDPAPP